MYLVKTPEGQLAFKERHADLSQRLRSAFLLFGMALLYADAGTLSFAGLGSKMGATGQLSQLVHLGVGMMLVGLAFKLSMVPFHLWTPDVYEGAPTPVAAFFASTPLLIAPR